MDGSAWHPAARFWRILSQFNDLTSCNRGADSLAWPLHYGAA